MRKNVCNVYKIGFFIGFVFFNYEAIGAVQASVPAPIVPLGATKASPPSLSPIVYVCLKPLYKSKRYTLFSALVNTN